VQKTLTESKDAKNPMGVRGRKSSVELAVVGPSGIETIRRPEPPSELTEEQAIEWRATVNRLPPDWFPRETHPMLVQYCRLIVRARRLADLINQAEADEEFDVGAYRDLLKSEEAVTRAIASLSTRMRLNQSSTMRHDAVRKPGMLRKPWEPV
jgi:hypothetical protein